MKINRVRSKQSPNGFTIVETLFVLAIAGIFLLIVFEAIPSLTRSSRNEERKHDVASILQAMSNYELSHSGNIPDTATFNTYLSSYYHLIVYKPSSVIVTIGSFPASASPGGYANSTSTTSPLADKVYIYNNEVCDSYNATNAGAGFNDIVALYSLESDNASIKQCEQL
jgi:prepilin-type N-terminal cleavage/methylation domain-containing protein